MKLLGKIEMFGEFRQFMQDDESVVAVRSDVVQVILDFFAVWICEFKHALQVTTHQQRGTGCGLEVNIMPLFFECSCVANRRVLEFSRPEHKNFFRGRD